MWTGFSKGIVYAGHVVWGDGAGDRTTGKGNTMDKSLNKTLSGVGKEHEDRC